MGHNIKRGDLATLRWDLGRDLSAVASARVIISPHVGATPAVDRTGAVDSPASDGIVSLTLTAADYGIGLLEAGREYLVEIETDGELTHPDQGYERLAVAVDLA